MFSVYCMGGTHVHTPTWTGQRVSYYAIACQIAERERSQQPSHTGHDTVALGVGSFVGCDFHRTSHQVRCYSMMIDSRRDVDGVQARRNNVQSLRKKITHKQNHCATAYYPRPSTTEHIAAHRLTASLLRYTIDVQPMGTRSGCRPPHGLHG